MHDDFTWVVEAEKVEQAKMFANEKHGEINQTYDGQPYGYHLEDVVKTVREFGGDDRHEVVAWLHDTLEDTKTTEEELFEKFGSHVCSAVKAITSNKEEKGRLRKHLATYYHLRNNPVALKVKLADRISNTKRSLGKHYARMYAREYVPFKFALYDGNHLDMWETLDSLYLKCGGTFDRYNG
jgi:(p)ppGpp synthase/HD superfamily hydrolase